ncbi:motile sperm domain-containing protein 2-like [Daktulosphaira vitifoliae]|uniref:motile sperm domain-containing protein 2-like n=1 Tax=Daktulosphaira vitifoliae TaxID=58002 RepID=UPI0021AA4751|nr:motile sperm domain-containing protein 2-like [Daktulosphaira vitifoliae]
MEVSNENINALRQSFVNKLNGQNDLFHPQDLFRINNSDAWLKRFLYHNENNHDDALTMLWNACEWRKSFGVNELSESNGSVRIDYLEEGIMYPHGQDKDGKLLFIIRCKLHYKNSKDFEECKKCAVYWFERMERMTNGDQITIFFDLMGSGISNLDMEFTNYLINLLKLYYPAFLNYIIIFEMPWVLNAAFRIIKSWLPAKAVKKMKFLSKSSLTDYVPKDSILSIWGGDCDYEFTFEPEIKKNEESKKKVHFAETMEVNGSGDNRNIISMPKESKLKILPSELLIFSNDSSSAFNEYVANVTFTNDHTDTIAFKIKTTCQIKYRVRPSTGTLKPSESITVTFVLTGLSVKQTDILRDKFLVLVIPVIENKDIAELWKVSSDTKEQHMLKCKLAIELNGMSGYSDLRDHNHNNDLNQKVEKLIKVVTKLEMANHSLSQNVFYIKCSMYFILLVCVFTLGFFWAIFYHK